MSNELSNEVSKANDYIIKLFTNCVSRYSQDYTTYYKRIFHPSSVDPTIDIQLYYDAGANKCYMELRLNDVFKGTYREFLNNIKATFDKEMIENFKEDTGMIREMIMPEDYKSNVSDSSPIITPFTFGYWKSLSGRYEFLEDKIRIYKNYNDVYFPEFPQEYNQRKQEIYDEYYTSDFNTFTRKMYELDSEFNLSHEYKPSRSFEEFIDIVEALNNEYRQVVLTPEEYENYNDMYMDIHTLYKDDPEELELMMENLNDSYNIITKLQEKVPEIFAKYQIEFENFFDHRTVDDITSDVLHTTYAILTRSGNY